MPSIEVGILGATGMVGQQFISRLVDHPWFDLTWLAASERSEGKTYEQAAPWRLATPMPDRIRGTGPEAASARWPEAKRVRTRRIAFDLRRAQHRGPGRDEGQDGPRADHCRGLERADCFACKQGSANNLELAMQL